MCTKSTIVAQFLLSVCKEGPHCRSGDTQLLCPVLPVVSCVTVCDVVCGSFGSGTLRQTFPSRRTFTPAWQEELPWALPVMLTEAWFSFACFSFCHNTWTMQIIHSKTKEGEVLCVAEVVSNEPVNTAHTLCLLGPTL